MFVTEEIKTKAFVDTNSLHTCLTLQMIDLTDCLITMNTNVKIKRTVYGVQNLCFCSQNLGVLLQNNWFVTDLFMEFEHYSS